jgi:hypothetical protein
MDLSFWNSFASQHDIKLTSVSKMYWEKYCYKVEFDIVFSYSLRYFVDKNLSSSEVEVLLDDKISREIRYAKSIELFLLRMVHHRQFRPMVKKRTITVADVRSCTKAVFADMINLMNTQKGKISAGFSSLSWYFETQDQLKEFLDLLNPLQLQLVSKISIPANSQEEDIIKQGLVILRKDTPYQFQVDIKSGFYTESQTTALVNFIEGADVRVSKQALERLKNPKKYSWDKSSGVWVGNIRCYLKNEQDLTWLKMLNLVDFNKIRSIAVIDKG